MFITDFSCNLGRHCDEEGVTHCHHCLASKSQPKSDKRKCQRKYRKKEEEKHWTHEIFSLVFCLFVCCDREELISEAACSYDDDEGDDDDGDNLDEDDDDDYDDLVTGRSWSVSLGIVEMMMMTTMMIVTMMTRIKMTWRKGDDDDEDLVTGGSWSVRPGMVENRRMREPTNIQEEPQRTPT